MKNTCIQRSSRFTGAPNAFIVLLLLLRAVDILSVCAFAQHKHKHQSFARSAPSAENFMTVAGMVSTLVSDCDFVDDPDYHTTLLREHRRLQFRAAQNKHRISTKQLPHLQERVLTTHDIELPRHTVASHDPTAMENAEIMLSRVSMVTAFVLMANELVTGQSLPDQICSVMTTLMMWT